MYGFSTDDEDSSDEEVIVEKGVDVGKLPTVAKDDATVQKKLERAQRQQVRIFANFTLVPYAHPPQKHDKGVISISRLPHGFYEDQLRAYLSQFGEVLRLRVSRNKKVGISCRYFFGRGTPTIHLLRPESQNIMHSSSLTRPPSHRSLRRRWTTTCSWDIYSNAR